MDFGIGWVGDDEAGEVFDFHVFGDGEDPRGEKFACVFASD